MSNMNVLKEGSFGLEVKLLQSKLNITIDGVFGPVTKLAVKDFLKSNNLTVDGIVGLKTWDKLGGLLNCNPRRITEIIVHCEATPEGKEFSEKLVSEWHKNRNFTSYIRNGVKEYIGYHYIIHLDGTIVACRPESIIGCHCSGHNSNSIGISYVGGCTKDGKTPKDTRTDNQKKSLIKLLKELKYRYPDAKIYPHYKFAKKACPCFDAESEYKDL